MSENETKNQVDNESKENNHKEFLSKAFGHVKKIKKAKWYHILAGLVFALVIAAFVGWHLSPKHIMRVAVLDKTILSYADDNGIIKETAYRKHQGLFWILEQQRYVKDNGDFYDFTKDYYGPMLDDDGAFSERVSLKDIKQVPDLMYVADAYGVVNDTYGYFDGSDPESNGISADDMSVISYAYESGATVVTEMTLFSSNLSESTHSQFVSLCGVTPTKWVGRYIFDLQDFTDVPDWAPPMFEQQEGVEWRFNGPGVLLVSSENKIIILEQNTDFNSKNLLQIYLNEEYKNEFSGCTKSNFYNWFELVEPNFGTEVIATFEFDLNATGMEKIKEVSNTPRFTAITWKIQEDHAPVYYFAGDFNDYTSGSKYGRFLFANQFF